MKLRTFLASFALLSVTATSALAQGNGIHTRDHRDDTVEVRDHRAPSSQKLHKANKKANKKAKPVPGVRAAKRQPPVRAAEQPQPVRLGPPAVATKRGPAWDKHDELARTRASRRAESVAATRARWQSPLLSRPQVKAELRLHARRIAKLERMKVLAQARERNSARLIARIDLTISKENKRHDRAMQRFAAKYPGA